MSTTECVQDFVYDVKQSGREVYMGLFKILGFLNFVFEKVNFQQKPTYLYMNACAC
jgi:hypothetical protein